LIFNNQRVLLGLSSDIRRLNDPEDTPKGNDPVGDIEHAVNKLGFKCLKIIPSLLGLYINVRLVYPCYERIQEL
jgi:hypothetical protein